MTDKEQERQLSKPLGIESGTSQGSEADIRSGTGFWSVVQSVAAAMIGVQSSKNKERDFTHGKPIHFIVGGVVGTLLLLFVIWLVVQYLLATS
ncbi:MAG: hypothetical protein ACI9UN_003372 [Granulosicoccus sp.]|jgi:hypothetical protein